MLTASGGGLRGNVPRKELGYGAIYTVRRIDNGLSSCPFNRRLIEL